MRRLLPILALAMLPVPAGLAADDVGTPIPITYDQPYDGNVTLAIDNADGVRVRNLVSESVRTKGRQTLLWDGRDDAGKPVAPGTYRWKGLTTKPVHLLYRGTVNCSGNPPWWKTGDWGAQKGAGSWLADHGHPIDAAHVGETVFLSAGDTENGHCILACDLSGNKLWGAKWFDGAGSRHLAASDGKMYSIGQGGWGGASPRLFEIDPATFAFRQVASIQLKDGNHPSGECSGLAVRDGKAYVTFNSPHNWFHSTVSVDELEPNVKITTSSATVMAGDPKQPTPLVHFMRSLPPQNGEWTAREPKDPALAAKPERYLRLAFKTPQIIGTLTTVDDVRISALKPDAEYPGKLDDDSQWLDIPQVPSQNLLRTYLAPAGLQSRALRFTLVKKDVAAPRPCMKGVMVLARRFEPVPAPTLSPQDGTVSAAGGWTVERPADRPIYTFAPAVLTLSWPAAQTFRGIGFVDFHAVKVQIEALAAGNPQDKKADWRPIATFRPTLFNYGNVPYSDNYLDLQSNVTAIALRLKVVTPEKTNPDPSNMWSFHYNRVTLGGITLFHHKGGEAGPLKDETQRLSVIDLKSGASLADYSLPTPRFPKFAPNGGLVVSSADQVLRIDPTNGHTTPVVDHDLEQPRGLAFDDAGNLYVADGGPQVVKVFSPDGKRLLRTIGEPGGRTGGVYNTRQMDNPQGLDIDGRGQLWVCEFSYLPKRNSVWEAATGKYLREFIGPSQYGGGGDVDPVDPSIVYYQGLQFKLDWTTARSALTHILTPSGDQAALFTGRVEHPIYLNGHRYMVSFPEAYGGWHSPNLFVARMDGDKTIPCAAFGLAAPWESVAERFPEVAKAFSGRDLGKTFYAWADENGDGLPQANELQVTGIEHKLTGGWLSTMINGKLEFGANFDTYGNPTVAAVARPTFTSCGAPRYDLEQLVNQKFNTVGAHAIAMDGTALFIGAPLRGFDPRGKPVWTYPSTNPGTDSGAPVGGPARITGALAIWGTANVPGLGEVFLLNNNWGGNHLFTVDGLYVATLFKDIRAKGARGWYTSEEIPGMVLDNYSEGNEAFFGGFTGTRDGRLVMIAGHNHTSVVEISGLNGAQRIDGTLSVTAEAVAAANRSDLAPRVEPIVRKLIIAAPPTRPVVLDGKLDDWDSALFRTIADRGPFAVQADTNKLYIAFRVDSGRMLTNPGKDERLLFKSGDSVSIELGNDDQANPSRPEPVPGDQRLLITLFNGRPHAVLYTWKIPGTPADKRELFKSPVRELYLDSVASIDPSGIAISPAADGYVVEAAIPLSVFGIKFKPDLELQADFGILTGDGAGNTITRDFWSNHNNVTADIPTEITGQPANWGTLRFTALP